MNQLATRCLRISALLAVASSGGCNGGAHEEHRATGAVLLRLDLPVRFGAATRLPVLFDHDRHTRALKGRGCITCHSKGSRNNKCRVLGVEAPGWQGAKRAHTGGTQLMSNAASRDGSASKNGSYCCASPKGDGGELSLRFGRSGELKDRGAVMEHYHSRCLACHAELEGERSAALPRACGACHGNRPAAGAARRPLRFDTSLHARHVKAAKGKCEGCHGAEKKYAPLRGDRAHADCLPCHVEAAATKRTGGPVTCAGCHAAAQQRKFARLEVTERLKVGGKERHQGRLILTGGKAKPVSFDHKGHEGAARFCTTCHHKSTKKCGSCHGKQKPPVPTLGAVHHHPGAARSCVGCHRQRTRRQGCAGCHGAALASSRRPGMTCKGCHGPPAPPSPASQPALPATGKAFPDELTIKALAARYAPSKLPHRKIVAHLARVCAESKLARRFHGSLATLCAGCHHHSPPGQTPPPCRSCHGPRADQRDDRPALKAAYHRRCLGCHQRMGIKKQGCTDCHAEATEVKR